MAGLLALAGFAVTGAGLDLVIRDRIENGAFADTERAATDWIGSMRQARPPEPITSSRVPLLQLVDSRGRIVVASRAAAGRGPLSGAHPPEHDRIQYRKECSGGRCVLVTASRVSPQEAGLLWAGEPHTVYAGMDEPSLLASHRLDLYVGIGVLLAGTLTGWATWLVVRRTLRPVAAMRARIAEITVSDLSLRVPAPPGHDAIAGLATTANETLSRLEEAVGQQRRFASLVSHELRSPLTGLHAQLEEALLDPDGDPYEAIRSALSTTERFQSIIDEMLVFARIRTEAPEPPDRFDLGELARESAASQPPDIPVKVRVDDEVEVLANRLQLGGALTNLLANAQRHAREVVEIAVVRSDGKALVTVVDDGDGIEPENRERVFEPFVRLAEGTRRDPRGSGLGLAISRAVVEAHGGTLCVEDSDRGARFALRLPLPED
ncbi:MULTISPECIES: sensor histidine kinase [Actinomadura]|uniref:histidine kinase n=2 Tax=Actinomadura yumaensis TaxID=111807 RepID=A0ABW2CVQ8_9ACTN|nr:ATP-binding protein [Actinomadura sp. J1-007]MWK40187.1 two-component sensor histidine kinase [Actinomadura sp. J1-007]